ncbi:hypothetical protein BC834DRAFT_1041924 [Gloeopeniophorella convolvens]|nr:hypothetical protein BC834DRAFT_1041924 [Gloeopeniophorella convolvens]
MSDAAVELNNLLQAEGVVQHLSFTNSQQGPNNNAIHTVTYNYRGISVGTGTGRSKGEAKRAAAEQALEYFKVYGFSGQ